MIISWFGIDRTAKVKSYQAIYDSGIEWKRVGTTYHGLDRGTSTERWSCDVTVQMTGLDVYNLRSTLFAARGVGQSVSVLCEDFERIFGPEFDYTSAIDCVLGDSDEPFVTDHMNTSVPTEWTFNLRPISDLRDRFLYSDPEWPDIAVQNVTRTMNDQYISTEMEIGRIGVATPGSELRTAEVLYEGSRDDVANAKIFLYGKRSSSFSMSTTNYWLFSSSIFTQNVKVLSIEDDGQVDKAGLLHRFTTTYARA